MTKMTEATYFILAALLAEPLHGYGIIKRAGEQSSGRVKLAVGTLYGALDRLTEAGLVAVDREEIVDGRARRYYRITDDGVTAVRAEAVRLQRAAAVVTSQIAVMGA
ncbi:PadR family transcriptional regulator [Nonomuraea africana]|uniref:DNA-binding PadR family transcriptional regulator n=1 Tax=Nonomuraea africana TaxID=46171 RepID=A0ABR9KG28_9ACTN|nr:PadR family transcriptional regulator [Nonomuraea africana]MBE1560608.1 DNA-binding PadR family transcriptional regulator [Nonomuraea africana]